MSLEDELMALDTHFQQGGEVNTESLLRMVALTAQTLKAVTEGVAGIADRVAKLETAYALVEFYLKQRDKESTVYVPFEVAFVAFKKGKTIKQVTWNFEANLNNIDVTRGWMPYDLLRDDWIILD